MEKEETLLRKRLIELSNNAYQRGIIMYSDFLNLNELNILHTTPKDSFPVPYRTFGGYDPSERQMAAFIPDAFFFSQEYPISCICIRPSMEKFAENLTHRDYLGAILNLGIERSKIGDILVEDKKAYIFCHNSLCEFLMNEICRVRHTTVVPSIIENKEEFPSVKLQKVTGTVSSVRLDSVTALAFSTSRSSILPLIEGKKLFVNGKNIVSNAYHLKEGDIVSVRGKGKYRFDGTTNLTKKNRYHVEVSRYC